MKMSLKAERQKPPRLCSLPEKKNIADVKLRGHINIIMYGHVRRLNIDVISSIFCQVRRGNKAQCVCNSKLLSISTEIRHVDDHSFPALKQLNMGGWVVGYKKSREQKDILTLGGRIGRWATCIPSHLIFLAKSSICCS